MPLVWRAWVLLLPQADASGVAPTLSLAEWGAVEVTRVDLRLIAIVVEDK